MNTLTSLFAGLKAENQHLANVEASLFEVVKVPVTVQNHADLPTFFTAPEETYSIHKTTGGKSLGVMGATFVPMQGKEFFNNIVETVREIEKLKEQHEDRIDELESREKLTKPEQKELLELKALITQNLDLKTLKFREFAGGSKIEFSIKMYPISFRNNKGLNDQTNLELTFTTSYDGSKSNVISLYTERLVCLNGMVANKLQGTLKGRNTMNGKIKVLTYASELAQIIHGANEFKTKMEALDKIKLTPSQIEQFKLGLFGFNNATLLASGKTAQATHKNYAILENFEKALEIELPRTGQTAYGLLQSVTYYTNHIANVKAEPKAGAKVRKNYVPSKRVRNVVTNDEYIRFSTGAKTNATAQELLFALVEN